MIERPLLRIDAWQAGPAPTALHAFMPDDCGEPIAHAWLFDEAGNRLGAAIDLSKSRGWFQPRTIALYESEDASLVFTMKRSWLPLSRWQVFDAEEQLVGETFRHALFDPFGAIQGFWHETGHSFVTPSGKVLASWENGSIQFADIDESHPFARMVMVGWILAHPR